MQENKEKIYIGKNFFLKNFLKFFLIFIYCHVWSIATPNRP